MTYAVHATRSPTRPRQPALEEVRTLLARAAAGHRHACPRQVLGVRMALAGAELLGLALPAPEGGLLSILETDGCFVSGVEAATGTEVRHRTLRVVDYGRLALTLADTATGRAVRLAPREGCRERAARVAPAGVSRYAAMLEGYQRLDTAELLTWQEVVLDPPAARLVSRPHVRARCDACGEEVVNERETRREGRTLCPACADGAYYRPA